MPGLQKKFFLNEFSEAIYSIKSVIQGVFWKELGKGLKKYI